MKITKRHSLFIALTLCLIAVGGVGVTYFQNKIVRDTKAPEISFIDSFAGFAANTNITARYISAQGAHEENIKFTPPQMTVNGQSAKDVLSSAPRYQIQYHVQSQERAFDITLDIKPQSDEGVIEITSLVPQGRVSLKINEQILDSKTPSDWAGRIVLAPNFTAQDTNILCLEIYDSTGLNTPHEICHIIGGRA